MDGNPHYRPYRLAVLTLPYGNETLPFWILIPMVGRARVYLKAHTVLQVIAGAALALGTTAIFFHVHEMVSL